MLHCPSMFAQMTRTIVQRVAARAPALKPAVHGLILVVGPDGAGKSTFVDQLPALARADGVALRHDHYRPGVVSPPPADRGPVTDPHSQVPRSTPGALVKLAVVLFDTLLGSLTVWRRARRRGLVVVDAVGSTWRSTRGATGYPHTCVLQSEA